MPIEELSEQRRIGRDFKVRLGVRWRNVGGKRTPLSRGDTSDAPAYPMETDYFVLDEAPEDVQAIYGKQPKSLRVMLYAEWNATTSDGEDFVFSLYNRAYAQSRGLRCRGTGRSAEAFGTATTTDEKWASRIEQATEYAPEPIPSKSGLAKWRIRCLGRDCPKYLHMTPQPDPDNPARTKDQLAPGHDKDASCKAVAILRCFLLDPSIDPNDEEHYCKPLGVMELATGSIHSIIDLQSDFDMMLKPFTGGRTAGIPLTLIRKPTTTFRPVKQIHHTCAIRFDAREVQRWAAVPLQEVFLNEAQRAKLMQLQSSPLGATVDSVRDLIPFKALPAAEQEAIKVQGATEPTTATGNGEATSDTSTTSEPASDAVGSQASLSGLEHVPGDSPLLVRAQIDELKKLAGGPVDADRPVDSVNNPWRAEALDRLKGAVKAMNEATGSTVERYSELRVVHYEWLKERLRSLPVLEPIGGAQ